jgi:predicted short-subunit dehydrogenase-like oxidoreductase (DUF2520 family)
VSPPSAWHTPPVDIAVVGAGRVGTALAVLLGRAGHRIVGASGRRDTRRRAARFLPGVPLVEPARAASAAELTLLTTPDAVIEEICGAIAAARAFRPGCVVAHTSGATGLDALGSATRLGASPLCLHPLHTFPDVDAALTRIPGTSLAVTALDDRTAALGEQLARDVGAEPFRVEEGAKPLYHAAAVFASNFLIAVVASAVDLLEAAGVDASVARLMPLSRASLDNLAELGPARALTGPAVRGDAGTVARNLQALDAAAPAAVRAYVELTRAILSQGARGGRLAEADRSRVEAVLARWG